MSAAPPRDLRVLLARMGLVGCACMLAIALSSAYLRLSAAGIGCAPWPQCYGWFGLVPAHGIDLTTSIGLARLLHRLSAMTVAVITAFVLLLTLTKPLRNVGNVAVAVLLCVLTVLLAVIGRQTPGTMVPLIGVINLVGGFAMLALYALLWLTHRNAPARAGPGLLAWLMLALTTVQIATGALASVTYSAPACIGVLDCGVDPREALAAVFTLSPGEALRTDENGRVFMPDAGASLQWLHRSCGLALAATMLVHAIALRMRRDPNAGLSRRIAALAAAEVLVAITMVVVRFPLFAALAHNLLAALLVVAVLVPITTRRAAD